MYTALTEERAAEVRDQGIQIPRTEAEAIALHQGTRERDAQYLQKLMDRAASILNAKQREILGHDAEIRAAARERAWERERSDGQLIWRDADGCLRA